MTFQEFELRFFKKFIPSLQTEQSNTFDIFGALNAQKLSLPASLFLNQKQISDNISPPGCYRHPEDEDNNKLDTTLANKV